MKDEKIFSCRMCGDCCRGYGGTFVTPADIRRIARFVGVEPGRFARKFCQYSGGRPVLGQKADGYCVFWERACTIHPVKPEMCRAWPFIRGVLVDPANWYAMADSCPGMRRDVSEAEILSAVRRVRAAMGLEPG
jgi:Fe-S-cluster containining protein